MTREAPHDAAAERALLGSVLLSPKRARAAFESVPADAFFTPQHRDIALAMQALLTRQEPIDPVTVMHELRSMGRTLALEGGEDYLPKLAADVASPETAGHYAGIVRSKASARALVEAASAAIDRAMSGEDASAIAEELGAAVASAVTGKSEKLTAAGEVMLSVLEGIEARAGWGKPVSGVPFGVTVLDEATTGCQPGNLVVVGGRPGDGKCLGRGTPVLKFDGSVVAVESVSDGDLLMGPDSKPRLVTGTTRGRGRLFRIEPTKGDPWVCNDVHVLTLVYSGTGRIFDIPLNEYLAASERLRKRSKLFTVPVDFPARAAPSVDPYVLGVWFGDGDKNLRGVRVTKPDAEIADAFITEAARFGCHVNCYIDKRTNCPTWSATRGKGKNNPMLDTIRQEVGDRSRLPDSCLLGSRDVRMQFLAGMLDTDGCLNSSGFEIIQKRKRWSEDVCFLARSLGFRAVMSRKPVNGCEYWRVSIFGETHLIPTRVPRKRAAVRRQIKDATRTGFLVRDIGEGEYFGFQVDGDGRFLLGDFTVTHNTALAMQAAYNCCADGGTALVFNCEMTRAELLERMIAHTGQVNSHFLRSGQELSGRWDDINAAARRIANTLLYVEDDVTKPRDMCARARAWRAKHPDKTGVIVADYLQMMQVNRDKGHNMAEALGNAVQDFKRLAKELRVPFILASQLNRDNQKDDGRPPKLSDFKATGDIEAAADVAVLIYNTQQTGEDIVDLILAKNRAGPKLVAQAQWTGRYFRFSDV